MKKNSINRDLSFGLSIVILAVGLIAGTVNYFVTARKAEQGLNDYINNEADEFAKELSIHLWNFDNHTIVLVSAQLLEQREFIGIRVLDVKNRVIFEGGQSTGNGIINTTRNIYYKDTKNLSF